MPFAFASANDAGIPFDVSSTCSRLAKSTPPSARPIGGMTTPSTNVVTMRPNAAPMMTATARSMTLPRAMKSRNSFHIVEQLLCDSEDFRRGAPGAHDLPQQFARLRRLTILEGEYRDIQQRARMVRINREQPLRDATAGRAQLRVARSRKCGKQRAVGRIAERRRKAKCLRDES